MNTFEKLADAIAGTMAGIIYYYSKPKNKNKR